MSSIEYFRCKLNERFVTYEIADNKAIVINIENGRYFDLNESATEIWKCIVSVGGVIVGAVRADASDLIIERNRDSKILKSVMFDFESRIVNLLNFLIADNLVCMEVLLTSVSDEAVLGNGATAGLIGADKEYVIRSYSDMELFLKLDPLLIHDAENPTLE